MIFSSPVPFAEAVASRRVRQALPGDFSAAEFAKLPAQLRERAIFSARTTNAEYLQSVNTLIERIVNPSFLPQSPSSPSLPSVQSPLPAAPGGPARLATRSVAGGPARLATRSVAGGYMDQPTARLLMKQQLAALGYEPDPDQRGTLQDLSSDRRINLIIETQTGFARGYGYNEQSQDPAILDEWPAYEMFRAEERQVHRDWSARWNNAIGQIGPATSARLAAPGSQSGFYALKNDPIWSAISAFGLPYPPFDYNSGMRLRDVDRALAESLRLIAPLAPAPAPQPRDLNESLQTNVSDLAPDLLAALLDSFSGSATLDDNILSLS